MKLLYFVAAILFFVSAIALQSCNSTSDNGPLETIAFSQSKQEFKIVSFYKRMPTYIQMAQGNKQRIGHFYEKYVYNPIWFNFASEGECSFLAKSISYPIIDLDGLANEVSGLSESNVEMIAEEALRNISKQFPGPNTTVYLQAIDPNYKNYFPQDLQTGIVAFTFGSGRIFIAIDPTAMDWRNHLKYVIAHEYHHSLWISRNFETTNFSLLEYLILEGRADCFAELMYPDFNSPWTDLFDIEKERKIWAFMKKHLNERDADLNMKMVNGSDSIPMASAYTIGFRIVQSFIRENPDVSVLEWTDLSPEELFAKSQYNDKWQ